jgi:hypothetical protein
MSQLELLPPGQRLDLAFKALRADVLHPDGPRISTIRNYRFALLPYHPRLEYEARRRTRALAADLREHGWHVHSISLVELLLDRLARKEPGFVDKLAQLEQGLAARSRDRALKFLGSNLDPHLRGVDGLAGDCAASIGRCLDGLAAEDRDRVLCIIGGAGPLYPFFRYSALLRHLDGRTRDVPVVMLYPGEREGDAGLSFLNQLPADRDYRPRIYP